MSRVHQHIREAPIREIGIERQGPLELGDRRLMLASANKNKPQVGMRLRQIGVELYGFASQMIRPVEGSSVQMVAIQRVKPTAHMGPGKPSVGARVVRGERNRLFQQTPDLVELSCFE